MVLTKETALNHPNTNVVNNQTVVGGTQQTTITTKTTEVPGVVSQQPVHSNIINKEAVVTNVMEKPVLQNVIEKKNVEVHHKNVVQEVHEQKIIEIEKQNVIQNVQQPTLMQSQRAETKYEEIGHSGLGEQERLRMAQLNQQVAPKVTQTGGVQQFQEREQVAQVVKQEFIERHVQPVVTEVREQNIVQEVVHPVVRKVHEAPIIREVTSTSAPLQTTGLQTTGVQSTHLQQQHTTGLTGTTTTTTTGVNAVESERRNMGIHEQKILNNNAPLSNAERQNLTVHEKVVDNVVRHETTGVHGTQGTQVVGTGVPVTHTTGTHTTGTHTTGHHDTHTSGTHLEGEQKPGFMERVKEKLHIGHHKDTTTTDHKY